MADEKCPKHGCELVLLLNQEGSAPVGEDCPRCMDEREARHKACADARTFGNGFVRTFPDGRVENIPPDQVTIFTRPNNQED